MTLTCVFVGGWHGMTFDLQRKARHPSTSFCYCPLRTTMLRSRHHRYFQVHQSMNVQFIVAVMCRNWTTDPWHHLSSAGTSTQQTTATQQIAFWFDFWLEKLPNCSMPLTIYGVWTTCSGLLPVSKMAGSWTLDLVIIESNMLTIRLSTHK